MFLDRGHPRFGNFNSAIPVDVIRVKSYVNSFLDPSGVPVRVSINKLYLVPKRVMAGLVGMLVKKKILLPNKYKKEHSLFKVQNEINAVKNQ